MAPIAHRLTNSVEACTTPYDKNDKRGNKWADDGIEEDDEWVDDGSEEDDEGFDDGSEKNKSDDDDVADAIPPPPEKIYSTLEELKSDFQAWTFKYEYKLVISGSWKGKKTTKKWVRRGRSGKPQNNWSVTGENCCRQRSSHKSGCPMGIYYFSNNDRSWSVRHYKDEKSFHHNHEPVTANTTAANHRRSRRTSEMQGLIQSHIKTRIDAKSVFLNILYHGESHTTDITQHVSTEQQEAIVSYTGVLFGQCQRKFFRYTLHQADKQVKLAGDKIKRICQQRKNGESVTKDPCSGVYTRSTSIPYCHVIQDLKLEGGFLRTSYYNRHWHIKPDEAEEFVERPILEPSTILSCQQGDD